MRARFSGWRPRKSRRSYAHAPAKVGDEKERSK